MARNSRNVKFLEYFLIDIDSEIQKDNIMK